MAPLVNESTVRDMQEEKFKNYDQGATFEFKNIHNAKDRQKEKQIAA